MSHRAGESGSYADPARAPEAHLSRDEAPQEPSGPVASDSLAAESMQAGGGFSENNSPGILGVKGSQSTLNTTDTSGASVLHPASSGTDREQQDALGLGSDENGDAGVIYPEGAGSADFGGSTNLVGYTGGPSSAKPSSGSDSKNATRGDSDAFGGDTSSGDIPDAAQITSSGGSAGNASGGDSGFDGDGDERSQTTAQDQISSSADIGDGPSVGPGVRPYVDEAPTAQSGILPEGSQKPKGKNLTEGGIPKTKTFTGNVGGQYDPGRLAEQDFLNANANADVGAGPQETGEG